MGRLQGSLCRTLNVINAGRSHLILYSQLFENHAQLITTLSEALCMIASSLPRSSLAIILYPTKRMREAVALLYAHIINFFIRAKQWYDEGPFKHLLGSFTRPVELRYEDLLENIENCTLEIDNLSNAGSRTEQRDVHLEIQELAKRQIEHEKTLKLLQEVAVGEFRGL